MKLTHSPRAYLWAALSCLALLGSACGTDDTGATQTSDAGRDGPDEVDAAALMCTGTESKACSCASGQSGRKTCKNKKFGGCVCGVPTSDAGKPLSTQDLCKAGYYTGNFKGLYNPGFAGGGLVMSGFQVMIEGKALNATVPALAFTLEEEESGPAGEFHTFTVGGGCMVGSANVFNVIDNPFVARITGSLDCSTGYFEGQLDGQYTLLNLSPVPSLFKGPLTAQFVLPQTLADGEWQVAEPNAALGGSMGGGQGTWGAEWSAESAPMMDSDPCAVIMDSADGGGPEFMIPDASVPGSSTRPDAGT
ncbi:MAG: hypothetical protein JWN48_1772 [Myxococcaceae bacterium]|nr:hypothetical protein [Myxococcaceae bacterium]